MNDSKNLILAVVLSALVLFGWGFVSDRYFPPANPPVTKIEKGRQVPVTPPSAPAQTAATPAAAQPAATQQCAVARVRIDTPSLLGSINLRGARIDQLELRREQLTIDANSPNVRLFSPAGTPHAYFASFGWVGQGVEVPGDTACWVPSQANRAENEPIVLRPGASVTLSWVRPQPPRDTPEQSPERSPEFQIILSVDANYLFQIDQRVLNHSDGTIKVRPFSLVSRAGPSPDADSWTAHVGPMGVFDGVADYGNDYSDISEARHRRLDSNGGWIGFTDKYWLAAVIPAQNGRVETEFRHSAASNSFQADFVAAQIEVPPGSPSRYVSHIFAGAKEVELLESYSDRLGTPLERAIDWGWFRWFMIPIFSLLNWLFAHIGNFGVAIICLTFIVRLLLFPIAQKQFQSMASMRVIQPKVKVLQERYADDKPRLQQEMMKLYKEEKVNPVAGCLPLLLQIPIFYALYKVLMISVEMRHEPFIWWIRDLSAHDPATPINLFGYLPFTPPSIIAVGVLPILVGLTMWLQMRLQPQMPDPIQRQIFGLMPWVLMFVMAPFAAGLQLYWVTGNILSIAQQKLLYWRHPVLGAAVSAPVPAPAPAPTPDPAPKGKSGRRSR